MDKAKPAPPTSPRATSRLSLAIGLAAVLLVFAYSLELRRGNFGLISEMTSERQIGGHQWLTASTMLWAGNWYEEGIGGGLRLFEAPASVEYEAGQRRPEYFSYPPGAIVPVYLLSLAWGGVTVGLVQFVDVLGHFLTSILLFALVYRLSQTRDNPAAASALLGFSAAVIEILAPVNLYYLQLVYCFDQAAIPLFAAVVCLETYLRTSVDPAAQRRWEWGLLALLFYGYITDWLLPIVGVTLFAGRLFWPLVNRARSDWKWMVIFWTPAVIAALLFFAHLTIFDGWEVLRGRLSQRIGLAEGTQASFWQLIVVRLPARISHGYGEVALALLPLGGAAWVWRVVQQRRTPDGGGSVDCALGWIVFVAPLIQICLFWEHAFIHEFSILKLSIPLALSAAWFLPQAIIAQIGPRQRIVQFSGLATVIIFAWVGLFHQRVVEYLPESQALLYQLQLLRANENLQYDDLLVSPDLQISTSPPQRLAILRKRIYTPQEGAKIAAELTKRDVPYHLRTVRWDGERMTISDD